MEIHELNTFTGNLDANTYVAVDDTSDTGKITYSEFVAPVKEYTDEEVADLKAEKDAEITDLESALSDISDTYYNIEKTEKTVYSEAENYKLTAQGTRTSDSLYKLSRYLFESGQTAYLKLQKDGDVVYQWQTAEGVPASAPNTSLIGSPVSASVDGVVAVPDSGGQYTYLVVCQLKTNTYNKVYLVNNISVRFDDELAVKSEQINNNAENISVTSNTINSLLKNDSIGVGSTFYEGFTIGSLGNLEPNAKRIATKSYLDISYADSIRYNIQNGYRLIMSFYSSPNENAHIASTGWKTGVGKIAKQGAYIRVAYASVDDAITLSVTDVDKVDIAFGNKLNNLLNSKIHNDLKSDGLGNLPNGAKVYKNNAEAPSNYGEDNAKYVIPLPMYNVCHIRFNYQYTAATPYVATDEPVGIFGCGNKLIAHEIQNSINQYGIRVARSSKIQAGVSGDVDSVTLGDQYKQRNGKPSIWIKYDGTYTDSDTVTARFQNGGISFRKNGTEFSSVSFASNDTIQSLVDSINALSDISAGEIDTFGTCGDLLIIANSSADLKVTNVVSGQSAYDCPKIVIPFACDKEWHTFEAIVDVSNGMFYASFDGLSLRKSFTTTGFDYSVTVGGDFNGNQSHIRLKNLVIDVNNYGDAEIVGAKASSDSSDLSYQIISSANPRLMIFEGHGVIVGSEAYAQTFTEGDEALSASTDRLDYVFSTIAQRGYVPVTWQDVIEWKINNKPLPKRCYAIMMDDYRIENYIDYDKRRPFVKHNVKCGLAIISDQYSLTDTVTINGRTYTIEEAIDTIVRSGWYPCSHTSNHRKNADYTPTQLEQYYKSDVLSCESHKIYSDVMVYPGGSTSYFATSVLLALSDFILGVNVVTGKYNCRASSDAVLCRTEIGTRTSIANVLAPFA